MCFKQYFQILARKVFYLSSLSSLSSLSLLTSLSWQLHICSAFADNSQDNHKHKIVANVETPNDKPTNVEPANDKPTKLILLGGQSNMGELSYMKNCPQEYKSPTKSVVIFELEKNAWFHLPYPRNVFGPEISVAYEFATYFPNEIIGIVKHRLYGNPINMWTPPDATEHSRQFTKKIINAKKLAGADAEYIAFFWMQGESDAGNPKIANAYTKKLTAIIEHVRATSGNAKLPVVFGQTYVAVNKNKWAGAIDTLREEQANFVHPNVSMIKTDNLPRRNDGMHLTSIGQILLGIRFAKTWRELYGKNYLSLSK